MSISSTTVRVQYTGTAALNTYSYTWKITDDDDLEVVVRDPDTLEETTLTKTTDYTVTGVNSSSGGTIVLVDADQDWIDSSGYLDTDWKITIRYKRAVTQLTEIKNNTDYYAYIHEQTFDQLCRTDQQQQDELDRCMKLQVSETGTMTLPALSDRASKFLAFDVSGNPIASDGGIDDALPVSAFIETLIDDATAADARTTLDAAQRTTSMTEESAPVLADFVGIYDTSATAERKVKPGALVAAALGVGKSFNLGLAAATTTNANDSIKIQGANAALAASNPLWVNVPHRTSAGLIETLLATADVTINLTGAHWGLGTLGDFTDVELRVYAINDAGTLKWGVSNKGGYRTITTALSSATATDINLRTEMLVNSTLTGTSPCIEVGWFLADFDDTGGAAEDLWAVQTAVGEINVGVAIQDRTDWATFTPTITAASGGFVVGTGNTSVGSYRRVGDSLEVQLSIRTGSGGGFAAGTGAYYFNLPSGHVMDTSRGLSSASLPVVGNGEFIDDSTSNIYQAVCEYQSNTQVKLRYGSSGAGGFVGAAAPVAMQAGDYYALTFTVPILGWSGN